MYNVTMINPINIDTISSKDKNQLRRSLVCWYIIVCLVWVFISYIIRGVIYGCVYIVGIFYFQDSADELYSLSTNIGSIISAILWVVLVPTFFVRCILENTLCKKFKFIIIQADTAKTLQSDSKNQAKDD